MNPRDIQEQGRAQDTKGSVDHCGNLGGGNLGETQHSAQDRHEGTPNDGIGCRKERTTMVNGLKGSGVKAPADDKKKIQDLIVQVHFVNANANATSASSVHPR